MFRPEQYRNWCFRRDTINGTMHVAVKNNVSNDDDATEIKVLDHDCLPWGRDTRSGEEKERFSAVNILSAG